VSIYTDCTHHLCDQEKAPVDDKLCCFCLRIALWDLIDMLGRYPHPTEPEKLTKARRLVLPQSETVVESPWVITKKQAIEPTHEAADAFWKYWRENGETHKHGYYESTWGAINAALNASAPKTGEKL
jgi:hypothetical protein